MTGQEVEIDACDHKPGGRRGPGYERWCKTKVVKSGDLRITVRSAKPKNASQQ
jgi:hypothetical protein